MTISAKRVVISFMFVKLAPCQQPVNAHFAAHSQIDSIPVVGHPCPNSTCAIDLFERHDKRELVLKCELAQ